MVIFMNTPCEKQIGANIRKLREESGMTQEAVSTELQLMGYDITRSALAKIEVGQRHVYADEIRALKEILNTTFDKIFYGADNLHS